MSHIKSEHPEFVADPQSSSGICISKHRMSVLPVNAEMQLFLNVNSQLYTIKDFAAAVAED